MSSDARKKAWETRRKKYGARGHSGSYSRSPECQHCGRMRAAIISLHAEGILSEGQACRISGLNRIEARKMADEIRKGKTDG